MRLRLLALVLVASLAVMFVACSGDDDDAPDGGSGEPTVTDAPAASEAADGDGGDDDGSDSDGDAGFSEEFGAPEAGSGGTGTIVLGDETLEYDVIVCSEEEEGVYVMSGRGLDADGEPFVAEAGVTFGFDATAEISRGSSSVNDDGDPHWVAAAPETYDFGSGGRLLLSFETTFTDASGAEIDGAVDVNCGP